MLGPLIIVDPSEAPDTEQVTDQVEWSVAGDWNSSV